MNKKKKSIINIAVSVIAMIALAAAVNIFITVLSARIPLTVDLTENSLYELSDKTKEYLKDYDTAVNIYVLSSKAQQDERVSEILSRYSSLNRNITVTNVNTADNPTFGKKYVKDGSSISTNSIIVDSGKRYKVFTPSDILGEQENMLNVENSITSALRYVSRESLPKAYLTSGHGEQEAKGITGRLKKENYETAVLNTLTEDIPSDASVIICVRPLSDFTAEEIMKLDSYMLGGGNVQIYLAVDSKQENMQNLFAYVRNSWGIGITDDLAVETDEGRTISSGNGMPPLIVPEILESPFTESIVANNRVIAHTPYAKALTREYETNGSITVRPMLVTSQRAYASSDETTLAPNENAQTGTQTIAYLAEDSAHNSSMYVSGTTMLMTIDEDRIQGLVNYEYFMNLTEYTCDKNGSFIVEAKPVLGSRIYISEADAGKVMTVVVVVLPLLALLAGIIVRVKRRNL